MKQLYHNKNKYEAARFFACFGSLFALLFIGLSVAGNAYAFSLVSSDGNNDGPVASHPLPTPDDDFEIPENHGCHNPCLDNPEPGKMCPMYCILD